MPRFIDIDGSTPIAAAADARAAINAPGNGGVIVDFTDYGACDGATNDRAAFAEALAVLDTAGGGTLMLPPTDIAITANGQPTFDVPANTRVVGVAGATRLLLTSNDDDEYRYLFGSAGDNVTFDGLTLVRNSDCTMVFFCPGATDGFHLRNCVIDGQKSVHTVKIVHGISTERSGDKSNITLKGCTITGVGYGYLQSNAATGTVDTFIVDDCLFDGNYSDDLEFNAPVATMTNVSVINSRFINPQGTNVAASLGIGLAHVTNAVVRDNYLEGYYSDAIHLEDYCTNVIISGNRMVNCANLSSPSTPTELDRAPITVMTGTSDVVISGNTIDQTGVTNGLHAITVKNLGGATTPGGRANVPPSRITITDNIILCGGDHQGMWITNVEDLMIRGNTIIGSGEVSAGVYDSGNDLFAMKISGGSAIISDNTVRGFRYGISGPFIDLHNDFLGSWVGKQAIANTGSVTANMITDCYIGIVSVPAGQLSIAGNMISNCVRPMVVGENDYNADPCTVANNFANDCTYPLEVGPTLVVERASGGSTVTVGSSKTVDVNDVMRKLPVGTILQFSGGGILTLTSAVTKAELIIEDESPYTLSGTVSGTDIAADEYAVTTNLAHSTTAARNHVRVTANNEFRDGYFIPTTAPNALATGESTMLRGEATSNQQSATNGGVFLTYFTAQKTETITAVRTHTGSQAQVGATHCRIGVYEENIDGSLTLVAYATNDTSLWLATGTAYTTPMVASFVKTAGKRYAVALHVLGTSTAPYFYGSAIPESGTEPALGTVYASSGTINSTVPASALTKSNKIHYAVLVP